MSKKLITPVSILSYPNLFEPRAFGGGEPLEDICVIGAEQPEFAFGVDARALGSLDGLF